MKNDLLTHIHYFFKTASDAELNIWSERRPQILFKLEIILETEKEDEPFINTLSAFCPALQLSLADFVDEDGNFKGKENGK